MCPYGNQVNKSASARRKLGLDQLWGMESGSLVHVDSMHERDRRLLEFFDELGVRPGVQINVVSRNCDGTLSLRLGGKPASLGEAAAKKIWISRTPDRVTRS